MLPFQWNANVKTPYYGWYGRDDFASESEARAYVARMLRGARRDKLSRPSYAGRSYSIKPRLMLECLQYDGSA